jgi:hypothetical protein
MNDNGTYDPDAPLQERTGLIPTTRLYTREEVLDVLNAGANIAQGMHTEETDETVYADDMVNLAVNAAEYLLDHPDADTDEVIAAQYTDVTLYTEDFGLGRDDTAPLPEKGSPEWDEAVVLKVRSWFE